VSTVPSTLRFFPSLCFSPLEDFDELFISERYPTSAKACLVMLHEGFYPAIPAAMVPVLSFFFPMFGDPFCLPFYPFFECEVPPLFTKFLGTLETPTLGDARPAYSAGRRAGHFALPEVPFFHAYSQPSEEGPRFFPHL